jgi:hypothetical protein
MNWEPVAWVVIPFVALLVWNVFFYDEEWIDRR